MKRLRKLPRIDNIGAQQRAGSVKWGRMAYLGLVTSLVGGLVYYIAGDTVVLSLDGTVLRDRNTVDAAFPARVTEVFVREGQKVATGQPLARLESFDVSRQLADLSFRDGELAIRQTQVESRLTSTETLLPLAEKTAIEIRKTADRFDKAIDKGIVSSITRNDALRGTLDVAGKLANLQIEQLTSRAELEVVAEARRKSASAVEQLNRIYDNGYVRAPREGTVGAKVPTIGKVVSFGDQLLEINGGKAYLLAYLPDQYLFYVHEGMAVKVRGAGGTVRGEINAVLPVADALPAEFQNMFRPRDRSRLVRIDLPDNQPFAVSQKVTVSGCAFGLCWVR